MGKFEKKFETDDLKTWKLFESYGENLKHFETHNFENHLNPWEIRKLF